VRTDVVIDDKLMREALRATGVKTKREVVELGLPGFHVFPKWRTRDSQSRIVSASFSRSIDFSITAV
jgi:Arc/MetJ family transcription regulator